MAEVLLLDRGAVTAPHWGAAEYEAVLREGAVRRVIFVAEGGGAVKGFAVGRVVAGEGELESVVVDAVERRRGVGRALCEAVLGWCRAEGAASVMLEVRVGSAGAIRLYEELGFVGIGRRKGYYSKPMEDALVMRREWAAPV